MNSSREGEERSETECVREDRVTGGTGTWEDEIVSCHLVVEKLKNLRINVESVKEIVSATNVVML